MKLIKTIQNLVEEAEKEYNKVYDEYSSSQNNISQEQLNRILKRLI